MKPRDRRNWIMEAMAEIPSEPVDALCRDFVEDYIKATNTSFYSRNWGAPSSTLLAKDLRYLNKLGALRRKRTGLKGNWQPGMPTWVWSYYLPKKSTE